MTDRSILTSIWTAVLAALVAILSGFGITGKPASAASSAPAPAPAAADSAATAVRRPAVAARRTWRAMMRGGSLPPTIKQRIHAEAHGKTPSVRRSTTAAAMGADAGTASRTLTSTAAPASAHTAAHAAGPAAAQTAGHAAVPTAAAAAPTAEPAGTAAAAGAARNALALAA
ncbi:DUF6344 domain-containing protein [Streptomyces sp. NBC_01207]|uniref:DUF6344 domain-containing protein n=1 Tax=Streptomyces sp. NBC_01207 TaxID=2903772 RepID=UPI002E0E0E37|nr:DUF6344 domain-containing protein [Streptomyces sp. NBC_01207]